MNNGNGIKHDQGKARLSLLPREPLIEVAAVLGFGADKYSAHNWRGGFKYSRLIDACLRHLTAWNERENIDPESGLSHLAHATCCLLFLMEIARTHPELDDRYAPKQDSAQPELPDVKWDAVVTVADRATKVRCP